MDQTTRPRHTVNAIVDAGVGGVSPFVVKKRLGLGKDVAEGVPGFGRRVETRHPGGIAWTEANTTVHRVVGRAFESLQMLTYSYVFVHAYHTSR